VQIVEAHQRHRRNQRLLLYLAILFIFIVTWITFQSTDDATSTNDKDVTTTSNKIIKVGSSYVNMNLQKKDDEQQPTTNNDGDDELSSSSSSSTNQQKPTKEEQLLEQQQILDDIKLEKKRTKRWNPCLNTKYELERHDYETQHGDVCRVKGGLMGLFECPDGCHETAGTAPYCANDNGGGAHGPRVLIVPT